MLGPAVRVGTAVARRNPSVVARLTAPITRFISSVTPNAVKAADKKGLATGLLYGTVSGYAVDQAIDAVLDDPDTASNEAKALIAAEGIDDESRDALIDVLNELSAMSVEGIDFNELPPEAAADVIRTTSDHTYGLPTSLGLMDREARSNATRRKKMYSGIRKIMSTDQILGLFMLHDIAAMPNRLEILDLLEEDYKGG